MKENYYEQQESLADSAEQAYSGQPENVGSVNDDCCDGLAYERSPCQPVFEGAEDAQYLAEQNYAEEAVDMGGVHEYRQAEYSELEYMPAEAEYQPDMAECGILEIMPDGMPHENGCCVQETASEEIEPTEHEFMVFAADGTLLSHTVGCPDFVGEPQVMTVEEAGQYVLREMPICQEQESGLAHESELASGSNGLVAPHSITLNVNVGGWNNIFANGWTSGTISVTSNTTWNLSRSHTWLTPSIGVGSWVGNRNFTVHVAQNTLTAARSGTITLRAGTITRTLTFHQLGAVTLTVDIGGWSNIPASGWTSGAIQVTSNTIWSLSRNVTWLTPSIALGSAFGGNRSFTVTVASNNVITARNGSITVSGGNLTRTINFHQFGFVPAATLTVSQSNWNNISANGGTTPQINVTSNTNWSLSRNVTWLTPSIALGSTFSGNRSFTVTVAQNTLTTARNGTITVSGGNITRTITFQQLGVINTLTVSHSGLTNISANGWRTSQISVTSNINWSLSRNVTWLTPSIALGTIFNGDRNFTVDVALNGLATARTGTVTVSGGGFNRVITFTQLGGVFHTVTFNANGGGPTPAARQVRNGHALGAPLVNPVRANHAFMGWFNVNAATGGTQFTAFGPNVTSNVTLWASATRRK